MNPEDRRIPGFLTVTELIHMGFTEADKEAFMTEYEEIKSHCTCQPRIDPKSMPCEACKDAAAFWYDHHRDPVKERWEREALHMDPDEERKFFETKRKKMSDL